MRTIILLMSGLFLLTVARGQGSNPTFSPEDTFSFVKIKLINPDGSPYIGAVVLKGKKGHIVNVVTNKDGRVKAKVPFDEVYTVHCGDATTMKTIKVSNFPYVTYNYQAYTKRFIYFTFTYKTPSGSRLKGEKVVVTSAVTKETYTDTTNEKGQVAFYLPFEPQFSVSVKYHPNIRTLNPTDQGKEYKLMSMTFTWMGAKEKERRAHYMDSLSRIRYKNIIELMDSLVAIGDKDAIAKLDRFLPIDYSSAEWVQKMLNEKAAAYKKAYQDDPAFFESKDKVVLAALARLNKRHSSQIIVTDITGSMYPYMEEVLLWHALQFMGDRGTKYLFFNDGDAKSTPLKTIGSTGGLYFCQGKFDDFKHIISTMRKGMEGGNGGDCPENDIEALLAVLPHKKSYDEVILVADNYSAIRDLSLMKELNVPVRVVLCGLEYSFSAGELNEEYLNLAYATGGSIHTIKEDVYDLAALKDGASIVINGKTYDFNKGKFIGQDKL